MDSLQKAHFAIVQAVTEYKPAKENILWKHEMRDDLSQFQWYQNGIVFVFLFIDKQHFYVTWGVLNHNEEPLVRHFSQPAILLDTFPDFKAKQEGICVAPFTCFCHVQTVAKGMNIGCKADNFRGTATLITSPKGGGRISQFSHLFWQAEKPKKLASWFALEEGKIAYIHAIFFPVSRQTFLKQMKVILQSYWKKKSSVNADGQKWWLQNKHITQLFALLIIVKIHTHTQRKYKI